MKKVETEPEDTENQDQPKSSIIHQYFAGLFKTALIPLNIDVQSEFTLEKRPLRIDVLIIRKETDWTQEQLVYIPDGLRDTMCTHIILELKKTESINLKSTRQIVTYLCRYLSIKGLTDDDVLPCLVSAMTPQKQALDSLGFSETTLSGVYQLDNVLAGNLKLLCANDLSEDPHNLWIKLFASTRQAKLSALETLLRNYKHKLTKELSKIIIKVISFWTKEGEYTMEQLMEDTARRNVDQDIVDFVKYFNFSPKDVFEMFPMKPEEIFQANPMKPEEIFRANPMKPEEIFRANPIEPEEIFNAYPDQEKLHQAIETYYMSKIKQ